MALPAPPFTGERKVFKLGGSLYTWNWWYEVPELPTAQYQVLATTANTGERGFDGEVYLALQGEDGSTDEVQLAPSDGCFQPSGSDSFLVTVADVGRLNEVRVRVDACVRMEPTAASLARMLQLLGGGDVRQTPSACFASRPPQP